MPELSTLPLFNDASIVSYYKLEDVNDAKGLRNLTNNNTVTFTAAKFNNGANLGSSNTNKFLSNNTNNPYGIGSGAFSVVGWWKVLSQPGTGVLFTLFDAQSTTTQVSVQIGYQDSGGTKSIFGVRSKNSVASQGPSYNVDLGTSVIHHIAMTYDTSNINLYLDGVLVGGPTAASGDGSSGAVAGVTMGINRNDATSNPASVLFDDVAIFTRALTAAEVSSIYLAAGGIMASDI